MSKQSHIERTAHEPRDPSLHTLTISEITQITPTIRLFRLQIPQNDTITFIPGQWVDLYPPPKANVPKPGGFTITSSPTLALPCSSFTSNSSHSNPSSPEPYPYPYIELAIQSSPSNPPAAYLFLPTQQLLHTKVQVRIGGSFVFPPPVQSGISLSSLRKIVFVAGGMGINPLMSMLSVLGEEQQGGMWGGCEVRVLYSVKDPGGCGVNLGTGDGAEDGGARVRDSKRILFLDRIMGLFEEGRVKGGLELFLTGGERGEAEDAGRAEGDVVRCSSGVDVPFLKRRMTVEDVERAVGEDKEAALVYACGVPGMTDEFVEALTSPGGLGIDKRRVLFEKWW